MIAVVFKYLFEMVLGGIATIFGGTRDSALNLRGGIGRCCEAMTSSPQASAETPGNSNMLWMVDTRLPSSTKRRDPVGPRKGELPKTGRGSARIVHDNQVHNACALLPLIARVLLALLLVSTGFASSLAQSRDLAPGVGAQNLDGGL